MPVGSDRRRHAQAARKQIEVALAGTGWPWSRRLSLWIDLLIVLEEASAE